MLREEQPARDRGAVQRRFLHELVLLGLLFVVYRVGRLLVAGHTREAFTHADQVWGLERRLRLPNELLLQDALLHNRGLVEAANSYYAAVHFPATVAFLAWLLLRRPQHYFWVRRTIVALTGAALAIHMLYPLAPPRLTPELGFIDTGAVFGPAVYGPPDGGSVANQFAAMPSLHIGWALLVAIGLIVATRTRWRWLWLAHPLVTSAVVVATANHYWLDGLVAVALLGMALVAVGAPVMPGLRAWQAEPALPRQRRSTSRSGANASSRAPSTGPVGAVRVPTSTER